MLKARTPPTGRTLREFLPLGPAEKVLLRECRRGHIARLGNCVPQGPLPQNVIRAPFLRFLLLGGDDRAPVHEKGARVFGAYIDGALDLSFARTPSPLVCRRSNFAAILVLTDAEIIGGLDLCDSELRGVVADRVRVVGSLSLQRAKLIGPLRIRGAHVTEDLQLSGAKVDEARGPGERKSAVVQAQGMFIGGNAFFNHDFNCVGGVHLIGARIGRDLVCDSAHFDGDGKRALSLDRAEVDGGVFLGPKFSAIGQVRLVGARVGQDLTCTDAKLTASDGCALLADSVIVQGSLTLKNSEVEYSPSKYAEAAESASTSASGAVRLLGATIGGDLTCSHTTVNGNDGGALSADQSRIACRLLLTQGFTANGLVSIRGAIVDGDFECNDACLNGGGGDSLRANGLQVKGTLRLQRLRIPIIRASLASASVGQLADDDASWGNDLILDGFQYGSFADHAPTSASARIAWLMKQPKAHCGESAGTSFRPQPWRQLQSVLRAMGHDEEARQVAIEYERRLYDANQIGLTPQNWNKAQKWAYRLIARLFHRAFGMLTGYGYRPIRLLGSLVVVWLLSAVIYWWAALPPRGVFAPSNPLVFQNPEYEACVPESVAADQGTSKRGSADTGDIKGAGNWYLCERLREEYTGFSPVAYSLDVLLPMVDLGQEKDWSPMIPTPDGRWWYELWSSLFSLKHWTRRLIWFETLFGWVASLLLVAIVSGLAKRRHE